MIYQFLDLKPRNPYLSLSIDEALVFYYGKINKSDFSGALRLWSNPLSVILGRTCQPEKNLIPEILNSYLIQSGSFRKRDRNSSVNHIVPLCRRASGGGTVVHGPGNINYSIMLPLDKNPELFSVKKSYEVVLNILKRSLEAQGYQCSLNGQSDITLLTEDGRNLKISGNSQFRKHGILMHHGTLITRPQLIDSIKDYLLHPPAEPDYRQGRDHKSFLGNLPDTFDITAFYNCLSLELKSLADDDISQVPKHELRQILSLSRNFARNFYSRKEWILSGHINGSEKQILDKNLHRIGQAAIK
jgi:lipoate---protein ligase